MLLQMGGSGGEVAIRVQIGASQPAGAAGMIWVNTTRVSNKWTAAVAQPSSPATGDIWIQMDAVSTNIIELLRKNSARINVLRVVQYDGSAWQPVEAHYHNGTAWTQISNTFNPATDITYTGTMQYIDDGGGDWRVKLLTSGTLTFLADPGMTLDAFLVGGGAGGTHGGGGGGHTTNAQITITQGVGYPIVVGAGGATRSNGNSTTAFGSTAPGGNIGSDGATGINGGPGGSAGGSYASAQNGEAGASNGNGTARKSVSGQGSTTAEFGQTGASLYGGAGGSTCDSGLTPGAGGPGGGGNGSASTTAVAGTANTGGGGGGGGSAAGATGGSGIVIIRNHRAA